MEVEGLSSDNRHLTLAIVISMTVKIFTTITKL